MRRKIFDIIEFNKENKYSNFYNSIMIAVIIISIIPLAMKEPSPLWNIVDKICVSIFIIDYILRLITADYKYDSYKLTSFLRYPFSFMAIIDLLSILPSFILLNKGLKLLRLFRMARAFRVVRVFKVLRYSKSFDIIICVMKRSKESLIAVCTLAIAYILVSALVVFNVEPESFNNFFEAVYWATVSLTTVGYGDIYPITSVGRIITMISSVFGIAIVALPAGIITAGYMKELEERNKATEETL